MTEHQILRPFLPVLDYTGRYIDLWGGRGRGGSFFGTDYFLALITGMPYFRGYLVRQIYHDIRKSLWRDLKDRIDESGIDPKMFHIKENEMEVMYLPTRNIISSLGVRSEGSRTANLKSLAGATHVLIEEADEVQEDDYRDLNVSVRTKKIDNVQIIRIFNPPSKRHWFYSKENSPYQLIESEIKGWYRAIPRPESGILSVFGTYHDNIKNLNQTSINDLEAYRLNDINYYNSMVLGLIGEGAKGRIYSGWHLMEPCDFESHCKAYGYYYVVDFGYSNDPSVLLHVATHKRDMYFRELIYEPGLDNLAFAKRLCDLGVTMQDNIYADYGAGGDVRIAELRRGYENIEGYPQLRDGFSIYPVIKGDIAATIGLVKSYNILYTTDSRNIDIEFQEYKWALDKNKEPTDNPEDKNNHAMDCIRYAAIMKDRM